MVERDFQNSSVKPVKCVKSPKQNLSAVLPRLPVLLASQTFTITDKVGGTETKTRASACSGTSQLGEMANRRHSSGAKRGGRFQGSFRII